jgi:hypothetical protein
MANIKLNPDLLLAVDTADWALAKFHEPALKAYGDPVGELIIAKKTFIKQYRRYVISTVHAGIEVPTLSAENHQNLIAGIDAISNYASQGDWKAALGGVTQVMSILPGQSPTVPINPLKFPWET